MSLNEKSKKELRKEIVSLLNILPEGQKIHLDKELLESLLFKTVTYKKDTNAILKLAVWSGEFLRKIDLSEVSFEDVAWSLNDGGDPLTFCFNEYVDEGVEDKLRRLYPEYADFSRTNAKIDFKKSFEFKVAGFCELQYCNFEGVDLSNNDLNCFLRTFNVNLSNTGIKLTPEMFKGRELYENIVDADLSGLDLSKFTLSVEEYLKEYNNNLRGPFAGDCIFTNTGINFTFDPNHEIWHDEDADDYKNDFKRVLSPNICGCTVNGVRIQTPEESKTTKQDIIDSINTSFMEQVNKKRQK